MSEPVAPPVLCEVVRSGFVEGRHRGSLVVLGADGSVQPALGDVTSPVFPRSSNKPMQAAGVLRAGLDQSGEPSPSPPRATRGVLPPGPGPEDAGEVRAVFWSGRSCVSQTDRPAYEDEPLGPHWA